MEESSSSAGATSMGESSFDDDMRLESSAATGRDDDDTQGDIPVPDPTPIQRLERELEIVMTRNRPLEERLRVRRQLAAAHTEAAEHSAALQLLVANADDVETHFSAEDVGSAEAHGDVAYAYLLSGDSRAAVNHLEHAIEEAERRRGRSSTPTCLLRRQLALLDFWTGDPTGRGTLWLTIRSSLANVE